MTIIAITRVRKACLYQAVLLLVGVSCLAQTPSITSDALRPHVFTLAKDKFEGRNGGYSGERKAADYIASEFRRIGLKPAGTKGYIQEFHFQPYHPTKPWQVMTSRNVLGVIEGTDPVKKREVVVIGAHYDGQGRTGQSDPTRQTPANNTDDIWNSANDNAASVAALIEIARSLKGTAPKRTILFAAFGAEEHGMDGSIYYVNHPVFALADHVAMINMEKLGRAPEKPISVIGISSSTAWTEAVATAAKSSGVKPKQGPLAFPDSDQYPFGARGIPSVMVYVSSSTDDAHLPSDTYDKVDFDRVAEAARFVGALLQAIGDRPERPDFVRSPMLDPGIIAHLITDAEARKMGLAADQGGLKVTGVIMGTPGAKAGLQEGDLILEFGHRGFARKEPLSALMAVFQNLLQGKLGVSIAIKILRAKKTREVTLDLRP